MKLHHILSAGVALATLGTGAAQAALVVVPPGLSPGQQYRLVFVTDGEWDATSSDIDDYNKFVTNRPRPNIISRPKVFLDKEYTRIKIILIASYFFS